MSREFARRGTLKSMDFESLGILSGWELQCHGGFNAVRILGE